MSLLADAVLAYGYNLGGPEEGWEIHQLDQGDGVPALGWYDPDDEFAEAVQRRLNDAGITSVTLVSYCRHDYPLYILATDCIRMRNGELTYLDPDQMADSVRLTCWNSRLAKALRTLEITPTQDQPEWLLTSDYG